MKVACLSIALALSAAVLPISAQAVIRQYELNIPRQPLETALREFANQTGLQVARFSDSVEGSALVGPVRGTYSAEGALGAMLREHNLSFRLVNERIVAVVQESPRSERAAEPSAVEIDGMRLVDRIEEVVVTGSRLRRGDQEGPAPVIVLDREKINRLGATSVAGVLSYVPQQTFINNDQNTVGGARFVRLRGLGLGTTLILVNGRRTVTSALQGASNAFDLNAIPLAAVERVEVLADSASAVYGADAVGGVVNIILKGDVREPVLDLYYGEAAGGGDERRASITLGRTQGRLRGMLSLDTFRRGFLHGEDRELYANQDYRRFGGEDRRSTTSNPGNVNSFTGDNLPGLHAPFAAVPTGSIGVGLTPDDFLATAGETNWESLNRYQSVIPKSERHGVVALGEFALTDKLTAFGEALYEEHEDTRLLFPPSVFFQYVPASNPFNPFGEDVFVDYLFTDVGTQQELTDGDSIRLVGGFRGSFGSWDWEASVLSIDDDATNATLNTLDLGAVDAALFETDPARALNLFVHGPAGSSDLLQSLVADPIADRYASEALQFGAFARGAIATLPAGDIDVVAGGESRKEELLFDAVSLGLSLAPERRSSSAYVEARLPIVSPAMQVAAVKALSVTLAGRYDDYDDFGSTFNPQYGVAWNVHPSLLLRASYGTSYRAPSLFELYQPAIELPFAARDPRRNNEIAPYTAFLTGNPNLEPEESTSLSYGFVFTPEWGEGLRIAVSRWDIHQDQRVQRLTVNTILAHEDFFPNHVIRAEPTPADVAAGLPGRLLAIIAENINFGELDASGLDAEVSAPFETSFGSFVPSLTATWIDEFEAADFPNTPPSDRVGIANSQGTVPRWRATGSLVWSHRGIALTATGRYVPSYDDTSFNTANGRVVGSQTLVDLQGSLDIDELFGTGSPVFRGLVVRAGIVNAFDEEPNYSDVWFMGFDPSQADLRQRFGYLSVSKSF